MLDNFDQSGADVAGWTSKALLSGVKDTQDLVIVVSGKEMPQISNEWEDLYQDIQVGGIWDIKVWWTAVKEQGIDLIEESDIWAFIPGLKGNPRDITTALESLLEYREMHR